MTTATVSVVETTKTLDLTALIAQLVATTGLDATSVTAIATRLVEDAQADAKAQAKLATMVTDVMDRQWTFESLGGVVMSTAEMFETVHAYSNLVGRRVDKKNGGVTYNRPFAFAQSVSSEGWSFLDSIKAEFGSAWDNSWVALDALVEQTDRIDGAVKRERKVVETED